MKWTATPKTPIALAAVGAEVGEKGGNLRVAVGKLQRFGALPLGNSGYLIPNGPENRRKEFEWLATIHIERGEASVLEVQSIGNHSDFQLKRQFSEAETRLSTIAKEIGKASSTSSTSGRVSRIRQRFQEIVSVDFFGTPLRQQVELCSKHHRKTKSKGIALRMGKSLAC